MNPDAICSCGSGKQYKLCCGKSPAKISLKAASTWFFIGLLVSGITIIAWLMRDDDNDSLIPTVNSATTATGSTLLQPTGTPKHLEYNQTTNKHYFAGAGHNHWHDGPPPSSTNLSSSIISQPLAVQPDLGNIKAPDIPNPQPWQYDPITNRYWDPTPGHVHWHSGQPPNNPG
ncbi:MAG: hypothetical protein IH984_10220 [Planctomycetes bacterium]|nr:hypothetical protein [Planctomycetota bacterium]